MIRKTAIFLIAVFILTICPLQTMADIRINGKSFYSVLPGTPEWDNLGTVEAKKEACSISAEKLLSMTNEELVYAIVDYPFLIDIFLCDDYSIPVNTLFKECDALVELTNRREAVNQLMSFLRNSYDDNNNIVVDIYEFKLEAIMVLLSYSDKLSKDLTDSDVDFINSQSHMVRIKKSDNGLRIAYVYTPNGTQVVCETYTCSHSQSSFHSDMDNSAVLVYGVTLISGGSCRYNCHSYAWYSSSTSNTMWINNPSAYMSDGSYYCVLSNMSSNSSSVYSGDKICYGNNSSPAHSAIVSSSSSSTALSNRYVKSKWGNAGVFSHTLSNVPSEYWYHGYYASAWRLN